MINSIDQVELQEILPIEEEEITETTKTVRNIIVPSYMISDGILLEEKDNSCALEIGGYTIKLNHKYEDIKQLKKLINLQNKGVPIGHYLDTYDPGQDGNISSYFSTSY